MKALSTTLLIIAGNYMSVIRNFILSILRYWKVFLFIVLSFCLLWVILKGYSFVWTGFGDFVGQDGVIERGKTLWDWMDLLLVPIFLGIGVFLLNRSERDNERLRAEKRSIIEQEISTDRQHEVALQSYLDRMADLLLREKLKKTKNTEARDVARILTLTLLRDLDSKRARIVVHFLYEADLITNGKTIISLKGANLENIDLGFSKLSGIDLSNAYMKGARLNVADLTNSNFEGTNLSNSFLGGAYFSGANLRKANLFHADLIGAQFIGANLKEADLSHSNLRGPYMEGANLENADITYSDLEGARLKNTVLKNAKLSGSKLKNADLSGANLSRAEITMEQLQSALSLKGAILPDGTKHN